MLTEFRIVLGYLPNNAKVLPILQSRNDQLLGLISIGLNKMYTCSNFYMYTCGKVNPLWLGYEFAVIWTPSIISALTSYMSTFTHVDMLTVLHAYI
jgi:hypothetical protein